MRLDDAVHGMEVRVVSGPQRGAVGKIVQLDNVGGIGPICIVQTRTGWIEVETKRLEPLDAVTRLARLLG